MIELRRHYSGLILGPWEPVHEGPFEVLSCQPSGLDVGVEALLDLPPERPAKRLRAGQMDELIDLETGEVIEEPIEHFLGYYLDACCDDSGAVRFAEWLDSLPIEGLGPTTARQLALMVESWERLCELLDAVVAGGHAGEAAQAELLGCASVGPRLLDQLVSCRQPGPRRELIDRRAEGRRIAAVWRRAGPLQGETLVFTGQLSMSRAQAQAAAAAAGAEVGRSVSRSTTLVVAGPEAGSKLRQAIKRGVPVIDEAEFRRRAAL